MMIGEFTFEPMDSLCVGCSLLELDLECCEHESFNCQPIRTYSLFCKHKEQCNYAFEEGRKQQHENY